MEAVVVRGVMTQQPRHPQCRQSIDIPTAIACEAAIAVFLRSVKPHHPHGEQLPVPEAQPAMEERWKGIGIRIEDDVAVVDGGAQVLTAAALKSVEAMER